MNVLPEATFTAMGETESDYFRRFANGSRLTMNIKAMRMLMGSRVFLQQNCARGTCSGR